MAEEKKVDASSEQSTPAKRQRTSPKQRRQQSAMRYITILFAAAFVLMLFTYLMERRQTEALMQENQEQIEDLQQSVSAVQSLKNLYAENDALKEQIAQLEEKTSRLETEKNTLSGHITNVELNLANAKKGLQAMDWFWQIDEAYAKGKYALCRSLIESLDTAELTGYLPTESITDNGRFSPADRLAEIRDKVY